MSKFKEFEDESDSESAKGKGDNTTSKLTVAPQPIENVIEFRNERLDYNFKRKPFRTWLKMMFPHFSLFSVSIFYMIVLIFFYVVELLLWINNTWSWVTYSFGSNYTPAIRRGHLQRLVIPGFLHNDTPHLVWNCFVLLCIGLNAEYYLGTLGYLIMIGASILLGNFFTAAFRFTIWSQSVGASPVIMAILAFELIWCIFNFMKMGLSKWLYAMYFGSIFLTTIMSIFVAGFLMDFWGHLAGFITGILVSWFFYQEVVKYSFMHLGKYAFIAIYCLLLLVPAIVIWFRNIKKCYDNICDMDLDLSYYKFT